MRDSGKLVADAFEILTSGNKDKYHIAIGKLKNADYGPEVGVKLLTLAAELPDVANTIFQPHDDIVRAAARVQSPEYYEIIRRDMLKYNSAAWEGIVSLLANDGSDAAVATLVHVLSTCIGRTRFSFGQLVEDMFGTNEEFKSIPFLEWLIAHQDTSLESASSLRAILTLQLQRNWLDAATRAQLGTLLASRLNQQLAFLQARQKPARGSWLFAEDQMAVREEVWQCFELLSYLTEFDCETMCRNAVELVDPAIKLAAIAALHARGNGWPIGMVEEIARYPETRIALLEKMGEMAFTKLVPPQFRSQLAFAEADLTNWLKFPTELNAAPDEIVFLRKELSNADRSRELYFFRFRTFEPHWAAETGWMVGRSGPFPIRGTPETHGTETFSEFEKWDGEEAIESADPKSNKVLNWLKWPNK